MKFSKSAFFKRGPNWIALALAVAAAIFMWVTVTKKDEVEASIEVSLNYTNIPPDLVVTGDIDTKLAVRVRGPKAIVDGLLRESNSTAISLANIKQGTTIVPLSMRDLSLYPKLRSITIIDIQPPRLTIVADALIERRVRVEADLSSPLRNGVLQAEEIGVYPNIVTLRGPKQILENYPPMRLKIILDANKANGEPVNEKVILDTPNFVTADPNVVDVRYKIVSGRVKLTRTCKVGISLHGDSGQYEVEPDTVKVAIEVPENLEKSSAYLSGLEVSVAPPDIQPGESELVKVSVRTPEGMTWSSIVPSEVRVTHK